MTPYHPLGWMDKMVGQDYWPGQPSSSSLSYVPKLWQWLRHFHRLVRQPLLRGKEGYSGNLANIPKKRRFGGSGVSRMPGLTASVILYEECPEPRMSSTDRT